jgi:N-acetyltransferase
VIDFQPTLIGDHLTLRPLREDDRAAVFAAASDPLIWALHPVHDRNTAASFMPYFDGRLKEGGTLVVIDRASDAIIGWSSYGNHSPSDSEVEIGWTFLIRAYWGGSANLEMKRLMLRHAFRFVDSVVFRIGTTNLRSRRAIEKIGGVLTNRFDHIVVHGIPIEHVIYAIAKRDFA